MIAVDTTPLLPVHAAFKASFEDFAWLESDWDSATDDYEDAVLTFIDIWAAVRGWKRSGSCLGDPFVGRFTFTPEQLRKGWGKVVCGDDTWRRNENEPDLVDYFVHSLRPAAVVVHGEGPRPLSPARPTA